MIDKSPTNLDVVSINTVESTAYDSNGNNVRLYCTNTTSFIGGVDYPSLDYIREVSPKVYQTGTRASSRDDYYTILKQISYLSKVSVWGAYEVLKDQNKDPWDFIPHEENVIHLAVLDSDYEALNDTQKNEIIDQFIEFSRYFDSEHENDIDLLEIKNKSII